MLSPDLSFYFMTMSALGCLIVIRSWHVHMLEINKELMCGIWTMHVQQTQNFHSYTLMWSSLRLAPMKLLQLLAFWCSLKPSSDKSVFLASDPLSKGGRIDPVSHTVFYLLDLGSCTILSSSQLELLNVVKQPNQPIHISSSFHLFSL